MRKALGALLLLGSAGSASASKITLPGTWFDVELPAQWSVRTVNTDGADQLAGPNGDALVYAAQSCATLWPLAEKADGALTDYGADFLPSGWTGKTAANGQHLACKDRDGYAMALVETSSADASWRQAYVALLGAIDRGGFAHGRAADDDVATLPGSGVRMKLAPGLHVVGSDDGARETMFASTATPAVDYQVYVRGAVGCDAAILDVAGAPGTPNTSGSGLYGFMEYTVGAKTYECNAYSFGVLLVVGPTQDGADLHSLAIMIDLEMADPTSAIDVQTLPNSGWKVAVPDGWDVSVPVDADEDVDWYDDEDEDGGPSSADRDAAKKARQDFVEYGGDGLVVTHADQPCDRELASQSGDETYDPAWLPGGWTAVAATDASSRVFCHAGFGGTIVVEDPIESTHRQQLVMFLQSIASLNAPAPVDSGAATTNVGPPLPMVTPAPETPDEPESHPILPFPVELAFQSIAIDPDRGYGVRGAVRLSRMLTEHIDAQLSGELGYDSKAKLAFDAGGDVALQLGSDLEAFGKLGYDQIGTGDMPAIAGGWYYGLGGGVSSPADRGFLHADFTYLWRSGAVDHEWRLGGAYLWGTGKITGITAEYRKLGDAATILVGARLRL